MPGPPGDRAEPRLSQETPNFPGCGVGGIALRGPGRTEHGDRRPDIGQRAEPLHELVPDPHHPPRVAAGTCRRPGPVGFRPGE